MTRMPLLIRVGSKIFNPRHIIMCEPVKLWVYDNPDDMQDGRQIEALQIHLVGRHVLVITPEEWQGVKALLDIVLAMPQPLPEKPQE